jgi:uncharacterized protein
MCATGGSSARVFFSAPSPIIVIPMKLDVLDPWYSQGLSFQCTQCGNCCTGGPGFVWVSDVEVTRLAEHLKLPELDVLKKYCRKLGDRISLKERLNNGLHDCVFLAEVPATQVENGQTVTHSRRVCTIYPVRPLQCRTWPFWNGLLASPENWNAASDRCPGINRGKPYSKERIEALRDAEDWPEEPPSSK